MSRIGSAVIAALCVSTTAAAVAESEWEFHLTPNVWAAGIEGTVGISGQAVDVDQGFGDLLELTEFGASLHFEAHKRPWGWFGDGFYVKLEDEVTGPLGGTIRAEMEQSIFEAGAAYAFADQVEALVGLRYQALNQKATFPTPVGTLSSKPDWLDVFAGLRWVPVHTDRWLLWLRGDIGGGDSDLVWLAAVGGGYRFNKKIALVAGYRHLDTDFQEEGFAWDIVQAGASLGVDFAW